MRLTAVRPAELSRAAPLVAILLAEGRLTSLGGGALGRRALSLVRRGAFRAARGKSLLIHAEEAGGPRALLLVGLGPGAEVGPDEMRRAGIAVLARAAEENARDVLVGTADNVPLDEGRLAALGEGLVLSAYRYPLKKATSEPPRRARVASEVRGAAGILRTAQALAQAVNLARELGDLPPNVLNPTYLKRAAQKVCREGRLRFRAYDKRALRRMKMEALLGVNQGAAHPPWLLELDYRPARPRATVCIVGKGLTFDSGGISLKPAAHMEEMKYDMCGAAATIGLMKAVAATRPRGVRVIGIVGATENMPGGKAYRPSDVLKSAAGVTIEVINTDAEGRVVLADALHHATRFQPDAIVDLATLTGAIVVALGGEAAGLFCKDEGLAGRLLASSTRSGERLWPMPTYEGYADAVKGRWGDVKNSAGKDGGACTAAAFLFRFTEGRAHAHLDIAGTAWTTKAKGGLPDGATGFGVRLLHDAVTRWLE